MLQLLRHAFMVVLKSQTKAALAHVAMEEVFSAADTTYTAAVAVEYFLLFVIIIEQVADLAQVTSELYVATLTFLLHGLLGVTLVALDHGDCVPVHLMVLFRVHFALKFDFIVTQTAREELFALLAAFLASTTVVLAAPRRLLLFDFFIVLGKLLFESLNVLIRIVRVLVFSILVALS